jgi:hypothetical protein
LRWICTQDSLYKREGIRQLKEGVGNNQCVTSPLDRAGLKSTDWQLAIESKVRTHNLECTCQALEHVPSAIGKPAQFIPTRFISANKISRHDRLLLAFDAFVLSETLNREVDLGKIIHGDHRLSLKVQTPELIGEVRRIIDTITAMLSGQARPISY